MNEPKRIHFQQQHMHGKGTPMILMAFEQIDRGWRRIEVETAVTMIHDLGTPCTASGLQRILSQGYYGMDRLVHYYGLAEASRLTGLQDMRYGEVRS